MNEIMSLKGTNGIIILYEDRVVISRKTALGFLSQGIKGDRTIFYKDLVSVEYRKPTIMANGYLQFIIAGTKNVNAKVGILGSSVQSLQDPNTIILRAFKKEVPIKADKIYRILLEKIKEYQGKNDSTVVQQTSIADELRKFKELLDDGIISQDEFNKKKKELLG